MARETQAELDQLLTPRERETLDLLRLGLTNREIAGRLDISVAGVRYHVSEIIGKLGVRNRYEAAAWPERPPWYLSAIAPIALLGRRAARALPFRASAVALAASGTLLLAMAGGAGLIAFLLLRGDGAGPVLSQGACPSERRETIVTGEDLTYEEAIDRAAEAITCEGYVLHVRSSGEFEAGPYTSHQETDVWVDLADNLGRRDSTARFTSEEARLMAEEEGRDREMLEWLETIVVRRDGRYYGEAGPENPASRVRPPLCHGPDRTALDLIVQCEGPTEKLEMSLEQDASYRGQPAIAMVATGTRRSSDESYDTTRRVFLGRDTLLPLGMTWEGTLDTGKVYPVHADIPFEYEFVRVDSLPGDFFDPASIGYVATDPEQRLDEADPGVTIYWLGREFAGKDGLRGLALEDVQIPGDPDFSERPEMAAARLFYRDAEDEFGLGVVVEVYSLEDWDEFASTLSGIWWNDPCASRREIEMDLGRATIYARPEAELGVVTIIRPVPPPLQGTPTPLPRPTEGCRPPGDYAAHVFIGDAFIEVTAPSAHSARGTTESPYNTEAAMELLVRSLVARD